MICVIYYLQVQCDVCAIVCAGVVMGVIYSVQVLCSMCDILSADAV